MSYLIKDTSRNQRKELVKKAYAISVASNETPTDETLELLKEYVDGKTELDDIKQKIINKYRK